MGKYNQDSIELIKSFIKMWHDAPEKDSAVKCLKTWNGFFDKDGLAYLLNQTVRQLWIPVDHYFISDEAQKWWDEFAEGDIITHFYKDPVYLKKEVKDHPYYVGAKKDPQKYSYPVGRHFSYRSFFHDEHIVPVYTIVDELLKLDPFSDSVDSEIEEVLDKIRICKMKKEENISLPVKRTGDNYLEIINEIYKSREIYVKQYITHQG